MDQVGDVLHESSRLVGAALTQPIGAYDGGFGRLFSVTSGRTLVAHAHQEWQLIVNVKGPPAHFRIEKTPMPIGEGEVLAVPPWTTHSKAYGAGGPSWMISLLVAWPWLRQMQANGLVNSDLPNHGWRAPLSEQDLRLLEGLCAIAFADSGGAPEDFGRGLARLLSSVIRARAVGCEGGTQAPSRHSDHRIRHALTIIRTGRRRRMLLRDLAGEVGLSRSHFFKLFRECVGTSPLHALDCSCISSAVRMLGESDKPIVELAEELGFSTQGHFTRFFVRHLFIPPAAYRARLRLVDLDRRPAR